MKDKEIQEQEKVKLQLKNKEKQKLKEKGITLIALVVTIILLLILAGVTISQIAGSNGLFQRTRQAVEKYKNSAEEEQIQIGMLEQYVSDFSVVSGDEGENKASVTIKEFTVSGDTTNKSITVKLTVEGEASKIQLSIDNGKTWVPNEEEELEGTEGAEEETEYTYTFKNLDLGKSYYVRVKVYDEEGKYVEAISDIVTLSNSITAEEKDVLRDKTYLAEDGLLKKGTMPNNGAVNETLNAGESYEIPEGYHDGKGKVTVSKLSNQTPGDAKAGEILYGKKAWVNGTLVTGTMENFGSNWVWTNEDNHGGYGKAEYTYSDGKTKAQMVYLYTRPGYATQDTKIIVGTEDEIKSKTLAGKTFLGVTGTATSDANAGAGNILSGKTAYVNGTKITGSMPDKSNSTVIASSVTTSGDYTQLTIPEDGFYNKNSKIQILSTKINELKKNDTIVLRGCNVTSATYTLPKGSYEFVFFAACFSIASDLTSCSVFIDGKETRGTGSTETKKYGTADYTQLGNTIKFTLEKDSSVYLKIGNTKTLLGGALCFVYRVE